MPYQRPEYERHPYQQQPQQQRQQQQQPQQQQQQQHYQQTLPHVHNVFAPPQSRQQHFVRNRMDPARYQQDHQYRQAAAMHSAQHAAQHSATMMMDNGRNNGALDHGILQQDGADDASQNFPNDVYYCGDQSYGPPPQSIYHAQKQDMAAADMEVQRQQQLQGYDAASLRLIDQNHGHHLGAAPPLHAQGPGLAYEHQMRQPQEQQFAVAPANAQHHHLQHHVQHSQSEQQQQQQPVLPYNTLAELPQHRHQGHQPYSRTHLAYDQQAAYANQTAPGEYPTNQSAHSEDYYNFPTQYGAGDPMHELASGQYPVELARQQPIKPEHHYATVHHQPEQLVRQELGVNPRKISRVSASAIASPSAQQQLNYHHHHHHHHLHHHQPHQHTAPNLSHTLDDLDCDQYPSDTDTYRVVSSSLDENDGGEQLLVQSYPIQSNFAQSATRDQVESYSPFDKNALPDSKPGGNQFTQEPLLLEGPQEVERADQRVLQTPVQPPELTQQEEQQQQQQKQQQQQQRQQQQQGNYIDMRSSGTVSQDWLDMICRHMIEHMNNFGICVIDNFLGSLKGEAILDEVKELYRHKNYTAGRLVSDARDSGGSSGSSRSDDGGPEQVPKVSPVDPAKLIRNDRVIWVDGCEDGCSEINNLIQTLCSVVTNSSRLSLYSGNALDKIVIDKRTKAHVACYPGNKTRYIKHVDNPNNDGRIITAIYYLNKDWNTKRDGGLLRMFPAGMDTVANIEPLFDRVLFFWSDRRNPHEVLPALRDRFAITVWYIASETSRVR